MNRALLFVCSLLILKAPLCHSQIPAGRIAVTDFSIPDTVCVNTPVTITNLCQGTSTYLWKFCPGTPFSNPTGLPFGAMQSTLSVPMAIALAQEGNSYYAFITNAGNATVSRVKWTNSLVNTPAFDVLSVPVFFTQNITGIQVKNFNGNWYGFVTDGSSLARLDFGPSLANLSPSASVVATSPVINKATGLVIGFDGTDWVGFCSNFPAKTITRFAFGASLASTPTVTDLGNVGALTRPMQPALIFDTNWYMFVANTTSISQLKFGNSLMNMPTGTNLGNLTWISDNRGVSTYVQCNIPYVLVSNHDVVVNQLFQIHFKAGLDGPKTLTPLGSIGGLSETTGLTETIAVGDTIFVLAVNAYPSISVIYFLPCTGGTIPSSTAFDPSPVVFPAPGSYTIILTTDEGLPSEQQRCRETEAVQAYVDLGPDTSMCEGNSVTVDAGAGFQSYSWNTGDTTRMVTADTTGTFSVTTVDRFGCTASDSIHVSLKPNSSTTVDTLICTGESYYAGGAFQTATGIYHDTLTSPNGCYLFVITNLTVQAPVTVNIGQDTCLVKDTTIVLLATYSGADLLTWQDGSHDSVLAVNSPGEYWVVASKGNCSASDTIRLTECPFKIYFYIPNAFSPNGDGRNDTFGPVGNEVVEYHMVIYDRWGEMVFETRDLKDGWKGTFNGSYCLPGEYLYVITWRDTASNKANQVKGTVALIR